MTDVSKPEYWSAIYQANDTGWDKGVCAPPIARMLREGVLPKGATLAVIGCGRGHEAFEAARLGFDVTAIDFAPEAIAAVKENAAKEQLAVTALQLDVFTLGQQAARYDAIVEHTCFCAIAIARRDEYVKAVSDALAANGVLFGLFYAHTRPDGPPYAVTEAEVRQRFEPKFTFERLTIATDSFEKRSRQELEFIARKR